MQTTEKPLPEEESQADELVQMLDRLMSEGTQHVNLTVGEQTRVQTVNSTACNPAVGACAQPNADLDEEDGIL